jgi:hypothetical protein
MHVVVSAVAAGLSIPAVFALGIFLSDKALNNNGKLDLEGRISGRGAEIGRDLDHREVKSMLIQIAPDLLISIPVGTEFLSERVDQGIYKDQVFRAPVSWHDMESSILSDLTANHDEEFTVNISRTRNVGKLEFKSKKTFGVVEIRADNVGGCFVRIDVSHI